MGWLGFISGILPVSWFCYSAESSLAPCILSSSASRGWRSRCCADAEVSRWTSGDVDDSDWLGLCFVSVPPLTPQTITWHLRVMLFSLLAIPTITYTLASPPYNLYNILNTKMYKLYIQFCIIMQFLFSHFTVTVPCGTFLFKV